MSLPLPNLDDRKWADLVDEGRALIPRHAPEWTDHNAHDPGITLIELFAYRAEQELYRIDRVGESHRRAFLQLMGKRFAPRGPRPARTLLVFEAPQNPVDATRATVSEGEFFVAFRPETQQAGRSLLTADPVRSMAGPSFSATGQEGDRLNPAIRFRAEHDLQLTSIRLAALQSFDGHRFVDLSSSASKQESMLIWGIDPRRPDRLPADQQPSFYIGLDLKLSSNEVRDLTLWLVSSDDSWGESDRLNVCDPELSVVWEYLSDCGWRPVPTAPPFRDETAFLSRSGRVVIPGSVLQDVRNHAIGNVRAAHAYLRCRLERGLPDRSPSIKGHFLNAVRVVQEERIEIGWSKSSTTSSSPRLGELNLQEEIWESVRNDLQDAISDLHRRGWIVGSNWREWPTSDESSTTRSLPWLPIGLGDGEPNQELLLPTPSPVEETRDTPPRILRDQLEIWTMEPESIWIPKSTPTGLANWKRINWQRTPDFALVSRNELVYRLDEQTNRVIFGDGERGRVPPPGVIIMAKYSWSEARNANGKAGLVWRRWSEDPNRRGPNRIDLKQIQQFRNPFGATGGAESQTLSEALAHLSETINAGERLIELAHRQGTTSLDGIDANQILAIPAPSSAINLLDFERLARSGNGADLHRVRAWAEIDPRQPEIRMPGLITVLIVPGLPADRPTPRRDLIVAVQNQLSDLRPLGSRVLVLGPEYVEVRIRLELHVQRGRAAEIRDLAIRRLTDFLHPLRGGESGRGWPFGRDVHPGEILRCLRDIDGLRHITGLRLATPNLDWTTESLSIPPLSLVSLVDADATVKEVP